MFKFLLDCDSVVMLADQNCKIDDEDDLFQYAIRLAEYLPVIIVIPSLEKEHFVFKKGAYRNIGLLYVHSKSGKIQNALIKQALLEIKFIKPLYWLNNILFSHYIKELHHSILVFHVTMKLSFIHSKKLQNILNKTEILITNSMKDANYCLKFTQTKRIFCHLVNSLHTEALREQNFIQICTKIDDLFNKPIEKTIAPLNILLLSQSFPDKDKKKTMDEIILEKNIKNFQSLSQHLIDIQYINNHTDSIPNNYFSKCGVLILQFTYETLFLQDSLKEWIKYFPGYKILLLQEKFINLENVRRLIESLGFQTVFHNISESIRSLYSVTKFRQVDFVYIEQEQSHALNNTFTRKELSELSFVEKIGMQSYPDNFYAKFDDYIQMKIWKETKNCKYKKFMEELIKSARYLSLSLSSRNNHENINKSMYVNSYLFRVMLFYSSYITTIKSLFNLFCLKLNRIFSPSAHAIILSLIPSPIKKILIRIVPNRWKIFLRKNLAFSSNTFIWGIYKLVRNKFFPKENGVCSHQ